MIIHRDVFQPTTDRRITINHNLCFCCGACVAVCPVNSIYLDHSHSKIDHETCTLCERCAHVCPVHALKIHN